MKLNVTLTRPYFFTYGACGHPFIGGWTVVAENKSQAVQIFRLFHPDVLEGLLNCCAVYGPTEWATTSMCAKESNLGHGMWERISLGRIFATED